jgi:hypothetical protein
VIVVGGENAGIAQGQHRVVTGQNTGNFYLGLLHHLGVERATFGDHGTEPIVLA